MVPGLDAAAPEASSDEFTNKRFIFARTPITNVNIKVEGLHGRTRLAALAAAEGLHGVENLGSLDARLRSAAAEVGAAACAWGDEVAIEVTPGSDRGTVCVAFRPPLGWRISADAGLDPQLGSALHLQAEHGIPADGSRPPSRAAGLVSLSQDGIKGALSASPEQMSAQWTPTVEMSTQYVNIGPWTTPFQKAQLMALSLKETSGTHTVRMEAALREVFPDSEASEAVWKAPICSTKTGISYDFLSDAPLETGDPQLRRGSVGLSGLLGDVTMARAEGTWTCKLPLPVPWVGSVTTSAGAAFAVPIGAGMPLADRFFLGGTLGGPAEQLPGFAYHGVGPTDARKVSSSAASRDYLGGNARASASAIYQWPLPPLPVEWGAQDLRLQGMLFGAAGTLVDKVRPSIVSDLVRQMRASVGIGVGAPLPHAGFLGVTLAQPLLAKPNDMRQRLQVWLSFGSLL
mmetsp:Transcript_62001/g.113459  ORF Transcript_62001/g.113459 Transcript_62001/m.113459 type:complete len:459 (+) Transcript_62001:59-1435(+)